MRNLFREEAGTCIFGASAPAVPGRISVNRRLRRDVLVFFRDDQGASLTPMKATVLLYAAAVIAAGPASAEVLYTFDDPGGGNPGSIVPFVPGQDASSVQWSAVNGGSMELAFPTGWKAQVATLVLRGVPAL